MNGPPGPFAGPSGVAADREARCPAIRCVTATRRRHAPELPVHGGGHVHRLECSRPPVPPAEALQAPAVSIPDAVSAASATPTPSSRRTIARMAASSVVQSTLAPRHSEGRACPDCGSSVLSACTSHLQAESARSLTIIGPCPRHGHGHRSARTDHDADVARSSTAT